MMNRKDRELIARELVKVARDLTSSKGVIYKNTFNVSFLASKDVDIKRATRGIAHSLGESSNAFGYIDAVPSATISYDTNAMWIGKPSIKSVTDDKVSVKGKISVVITAEIYKVEKVVEETVDSYLTLLDDVSHVIIN
jgi:hypothetical protein